MTNEKAKKMLKAKLECLKRETSGTDDACNQHLCEGCSLNYEQGNMGEQKEALEMAIKALEQTMWIPCSERLPEKQGCYLVTTKWKGSYSGDIYIETNMAVYRKQRKEWDCVDVIAWMPLPQPYKAEMEGEEC